MKINFNVVNAFWDKAFHWNPAWIFYYADWLENDIMQKIAKQMNLVESVFVFKWSKNYDFELKYFTPIKELPIAWHPTIATFSWLLQNWLLEKWKEIYSIKTWRWIVQVRINHESKNIFLEQPKPIFLWETNDIKKIAEVFEVNPEDIDSKYPIAFVTTWLGHIIVPFKDINSLMKAKRNIKLLKEICDNNWVSEAQIFTFDTFNKKYDLHTRNICPREWIEDPACWIWSWALLAYIDRYIYKEKNKFSLLMEQWNIINMPSLVSWFVENWIVTTWWTWVVMIEWYFNI